MNKINITSPTITITKVVGLTYHPIISIVIPLYNKASTIQHTISSVISQTIQNFELIIVDGNSTDGSFEIASQINDPRIVLFKQHGKGISTARNQGVEKAKSDIVAFLDADDTWEPNFLETILQLTEKYPNAGMYGTAFAVCRNNNPLRTVSLDTDKDGDLLSYFSDFTEAGHPIIITSAFAVRKSAFLVVGGYSETLRVGEDHDLFGKLALQYPVSYSPKICSRYNLASENNTDTVDYVLGVPLEEYLTEHNHWETAEKKMGFSEFLDHWRIRTGGRNIYSGFRREGRVQIRKVSTNKSFLLKYGFLLISYLPIPYRILSANFVRRVLRLLQISI